jgi:hypothetical protein
MNYRANRFTTYVENPVNPADLRTQFYFPDQPLIRYCPIYSVVAYSPNVNTRSGLTGQPLVSYANMQQAYLWLYTKDPETGEEKYGVQSIPLLELNYINDGTSAYVWDMPMMAGQQVYWEKSYVQVGVALGNTPAQVWGFGVRFGPNFANNS